MNTEPKRRGRPKGSNSFANLTLAELNQRFKQDDVIPVGRLFLEKGATPTKVQVITNNDQPRVVGLVRDETPAVEMTLSE